MHIRLYKDAAKTQVFRDFVTGIVESYTNTPTISSKTIGDETYWYTTSSLVGASGGESGGDTAAPVVSSNDMLGNTSSMGQWVNMYFPVTGVVQLRGRNDFSGANNMGVGIRNPYYDSTLINTMSSGKNKHQDSPNEAIGVFAYEVTIGSIEMIYFSTNLLSEGVGLIGFGVSKNLFEHALVPRFEGEESDDSPNGGYGDKQKGDGLGRSGLPTKGLAVGSGLHVYAINTANLNSLVSKLWGKDENIFSALWDKFKNFKFNPIAGVISCVAIPDEFSTISTSGSTVLMAGTVMNGVSAGSIGSGGGCIASYTMAVSVGEYFGSYQDYTDCTRCTLHIPFCGSVELSPSAVSGRTVSVVFVCDIVSGNVTATVEISGKPVLNASGNWGDRGGAIAEASGNCAYSVPITGNDNGMGDKIAAIKSYSVGNISGAESAISSGNMNAGVWGRTAGAAWNIATAKHTTQVVGSLGGGVSLVEDTRCYLEIERMPPSKPSHYFETTGGTSNIGGTVGSFSGYAEFSAVNVNIAGATDEEKEEIRNLLMEGVFI